MWTNLGIYGGHVQDIAIDHQTPGNIFAATYMGRGLFRSGNGGASWQAVDMNHAEPDEATFNEHSVYAVAIAPGDADIIWVAHDYWLAKSTDGGQTWSHIPNNTMQGTCNDCAGYDDTWRLCRAIAIDPTDPNLVYVGTGGHETSDTAGAVFGTTDGGVTWNKLNGGSDLDFRVEDLAVGPGVGPGDPAVIWAVTNSNGDGGSYDGSVYRSADGGTGFIAIAPKPDTGGILAVAPKPDDAGIVFVGGGMGIIQLTLNGTKWDATRPVDESRMAADIVFAPSDPGTVYASWMNAIGDGLPKVTRGVYSGTVWTWETLEPDTKYITAFQCLAVHPADADTLLGGDDSLGMLITPDHGRNWTPINEGLDAVTVYDVDVENTDTGHMLAATIAGLYERADRLSAWVRRHSGPFRSVKFHPDSGNAYFGGGYGFVARTTDNGGTWYYSNNLGPVFVTDIDVDPSETSSVFITTGQYGRQVQRSTNGGASFQVVLDGINQDYQPYSMNKVVIDPHDHQHILASGGNFHAPYVKGDLWESDDGGATWSRTGLTDIVVNDILVDPRNPGLLYAGCGYSLNYREPIYKSINGGVDWTLATTGMALARRSLYSIWSASENQVFSVGSAGYITFYDGTQWVAQDSGTENILYGIHGTSAGNVYAVGQNGTILNFDSQGWTAFISPTTQDLYKVWTSPSGLNYAVGQGGIILHRSFFNWTGATSPTSENLYEIRGVSSSDIFAAGASGTILHYDGSDWTPMSSGTGVDLYALWPFSATDVFAVGDGGVILRYDGSGWTPMTSNTTENLWGVWGSSASDVYASSPDGVLMHYNGSQWSQVDLNPTRAYQEIWGVTSSRLYMTDASGEVWLYDSGEITKVRAVGTYKRSATGMAFHRSNPDIVYAATSGAGVYISTNQAGNWLNLGTPPTSVYDIESGSLYAATGDGVYELTGTGVVTGDVNDAGTSLGIDSARVSTDLGNQCRSIDGSYMMVVPSGIFDLYAMADSYELGTAEDINVTGSDVTRHNFALNRDDNSTPDNGGDPPEGDPDPDGSSGGGGGGGCFIQVSFR
ncbi:MAG: hypothetical protein HKM93_18765 [Desulfobacteraceae bacterium]|nr:hypothetical protein [Desulfobacteraceae bacterium]